MSSIRKNPSPSGSSSSYAYDNTSEEIGVGSPFRDLDVDMPGPLCDTIELSNPFPSSKRLKMVSCLILLELLCWSTISYSRCTQSMF